MDAFHDRPTACLLHAVYNTTREPYDLVFFDGFEIIVQVELGLQQQSGTSEQSLAHDTEAENVRHWLVN